MLHLGRQQLIIVTIIALAAMRPAVAAEHVLAREECGTTVLIVHNFGKDQRKGARGTSALPSDTDVNLEMYRDDAGRITLHADKLKDAELPPDIGLQLRKVYLKERWGTESSCVIESGELAVTKPDKKDKDQPVLDYLAEHPGSSGASMARALKQNKDNTNKQLKRLKDEGKVMSEGTTTGLRRYVMVSRIERPAQRAEARADRNRTQYGSFDFTCLDCSSRGTPSSAKTLRVVFVHGSS